jgi:hypothetical protein
MSFSGIVSYLENGMETRLQHEQLLAIAEANGYDNVVDYVKSLNPYSYYHRLSGEVEARNAVKRMGMTAERRRQSLAEETEDVSRKDQIILYDLLGSEMRFSKNNANQEVFVSNAQRAVEGIKQDKATPEQWLKMIEKQGGLKAGEDKWLGLSDWLKASDKKSITKQEVLDFINENKIIIKEVEYNETNNQFEEIKAEYEGLRIQGFDFAKEVMEERYGYDFFEAFDDLGGELVVTDYEAASALLGGNRLIFSTRLEYTTEGLNNKREIALIVPTIESWNERDEMHFGDAGDGRAVAWVRFGETTDSDGNRVLVIDEIQSKRHQEGREKGYKNEEIEKLSAEKEVWEDKLHYEGLTEKEYKRYKELTELLYELDPHGNIAYAIPSAPFEKNWHELAMKRMLRLAAEEGYDKVAWTKGEQQAERYDIGRAVGVINSKPTEHGYTVDIVLKSGGSDIMLDTDKEGVITDGYGDNEYEGKHLSDVVGKELSARLMTDKIVQLDGDNLRIGGEGMKGFYDEILPRFMNKYGKKWGTKVEDVELPNVEEAGRVMHSVDVTDEMRESVMEGQVMFSRKGVNNNMLSDDTRFSRDNKYVYHRTTKQGLNKILTEGFNLNDGYRRESGVGVYSFEDVEDANRPYAKKKYGNYIVRIPIDGIDFEETDKVSAMNETKQGIHKNRVYTIPYLGRVTVLKDFGDKQAYQYSKDNGKTWYDSNHTLVQDDTRFSRKMGEAKAQLADMKYGETVRMDALAQAKAMFLQGEPMEDIFAQTGWKQQNAFGKPTWIYTEADLSAREKLDRFLKSDRKSEIEMLTLGNKKLSELRAMLGGTINMKTFKTKLQEFGKSEKEVREDLADLLKTFGESMSEGVVATLQA